jgi:hypothetical protein
MHREERETVRRGDRGSAALRSRRGGRFSLLLSDGVFGDIIQF